jgi:hypothetical protein
MIFILGTLLAGVFGFLTSFAGVQTGVVPLFKGTAFAGICVIIVGIVILVGGIAVWLYKSGKFPSLSGVFAGQIAVLSNAGIITGGVLFGLWGGSLIGEYEIWNIVFSRFNQEVVAIFGALILTIESIIARWLCQNKGEDKDSTFGPSEKHQPEHGNYAKIESSFVRNNQRTLKGRDINNG